VDGASQRTLESLRTISSVLAHSLSAEGLLKDFLLHLRTILGVNRAAVFLRPPPGAVDAAPDPAETQLQLSCSIGLAPELLQHLALSLFSGVGGAVARTGRIVRRTDESAQSDPEMRKEFELLGAEVAVPILDRETMLGIALLDHRVTGEPLANEELALIFYLLEGVGMALRNIRLHDQLAARHELMTDILGQFNCACVVIARDMSVLHANQMALDCFAPPGRGLARIEFSDLPQELGSRVFEALKSGLPAGPFKHHFAHLKDRAFQVSVTPFRKSSHPTPDAVLLLAEDCTRDEQHHQLEIEATNLRTVRTMAERLAHEIGNAIVPLSTHQQLFSEKIDDGEFRSSLQAALTDAVKRISRLNQQMLFLAQDRAGMKDAITVNKLIEEAFREAQKHHTETPVYLQYESANQHLTLSGDRVGLRHALAEVMLNAVQANPPMPKVKVTARADTDAAGQHWVHIDVQDSGSGFTPDVAKKVTEPFFTTRNVGLGLGLAVCRKIIETHQGTLKIAEPRAGQSGLVTISLPTSSN
jgi:nitrogen-specific signal transduction histidine kinase